MRTDNNNNPTAFTTDLAKEAKLIQGVDYVQGTPFPYPSTLNTARIIGDSIEVTIKLITAVGYFTHENKPRWTYIALPYFVWISLTPEQKRDVIGYHYKNEGGITMKHLFPNYGEK